ncbi:MAG: hypothetical protein PHQ89_02900 [Bacilli bacterium]|nr:hypothetical protein [Bacilli bacterium]
MAINNAVNSAIKRKIDAVLADVKSHINEDYQAREKDLLKELPKDFNKLEAAAALKKEEALRKLDELVSAINSLDDIERQIAGLGELQAAATISETKKVIQLVNKYANNLYDRKISITSDLKNKLEKANNLYTTKVLEGATLVEKKYQVPINEANIDMAQSLKPLTHTSELEQSLAEKQAEETILETKLNDRVINPAAIAQKEDMDAQKLQILKKNGVPIRELSLKKEQYLKLSDSYQKQDNILTAGKVIGANKDFPYSKQALEALKKTLIVNEKDISKQEAGMSK